VYRLELEEVGLEEMLLETRYLSPADRDNPAAVETALGKLVAFLILEGRYR
jgi:hypothetical protein